MAKKETLWFHYLIILAILFYIFSFLPNIFFLKQKIDLIHMKFIYNLKIEKPDNK